MPVTAGGQAREVPHSKCHRRGRGCPITAVTAHRPQPDTLCIDTCDTCGSYIKSLARLDPVPHEVLAAKDLATAHLDLLAIERGYTRQA